VKRKSATPARAQATSQAFLKLLMRFPHLWNNHGQFGYFSSSTSTHLGAGDHVAKDRGDLRLLILRCPPGEPDRERFQVDVETFQGQELTAPTAQMVSVHQQQLQFFQERSIRCLYLSRARNPSRALPSGSSFTVITQFKSSGSSTAARCKARRMIASSRLIVPLAACSDPEIDVALKMTCAQVCRFLLTTRSEAPRPPPCPAPRPSLTGPLPIEI